MKLNKKERKTIRYYDVSGKEWVQRHSTDPEDKKFLVFMDFIFKLIPKGKVIEIGSGDGTDAKYLINHYGNDNYLGVDPSKGLLEIAKKNNPKAKFINTSIYELRENISNEKFDVFWLCAVLLHLPKDRLREAMESLKSVLNESAVGFISILEGDVDMENSRPGRYFSLWKQKDFSNILVELGFEILKEERVPNNYPEGNDWLAYIIKKV